MSDNHPLIALAGVLAALGWVAAAQAVSIETHDNPVSAGTITVAPGDNDRSDWAGIPGYASDPADDGIPEIDWLDLQVAHDSTNVYLRYLLTDTSVDDEGPQNWLGFRHNVYIDTDQDYSTGFVGFGSFLAVGADYLIQGATVFEFTGADQETWGWNAVTGVLSYDDFPDTDIELSVPRSSLGDSEAFDFLLNGSNTEFLFEDYYPDASSAGATGDYFTYALSDPPSTEGDYNGDSKVDAADYAVWRNSLNDIGVGLPADGNGDEVVDDLDYDLWRQNYGAGGAPVAGAIVAAPEPTGVAMLALIVAGAGAVSGRSRRIV